MSDPVDPGTAPDDDTTEVDQPVAGERSVVDDTEELDTDDVNNAAAQGDYNHLDHVGDPAPDEESAEVERIVAGIDQPDGGD